jgi:hypothetical protein
MIKLPPMLKSRLVLLSILIVWAALLLFTWRGWYQIFITVLSRMIHNEDLKFYCYCLWIAQDQDVNTIFGGNPDVTVSSMIGVVKLSGSKTALYVANVVDKLFYLAVKQVNHCVVSIEHDEEHWSFGKRFESIKAEQI